MVDSNVIAATDILEMDSSAEKLMTLQCLVWSAVLGLVLMDILVTNSNVKILMNMMQ